MRSFARLFSSSRRAPPNAASNFHLSNAWRRPSVFMTWVCSADPDVMGEMPRLSPSSFTCTRRSIPRRAAVSSRNAIISRNFQVVSTCSKGNGGLPGAKAFCAICSIALEILADRIKHDRIAEFGNGLPQYIDRLRLETAQADIFVSPVHFAVVRRRACRAGGNFEGNYGFSARRTASMMRSCVPASR